MDGTRFDELSRRFATRRTRRSVLGLIGAAAAGILTSEAVDSAPKKEKPPKEKPKKCYGEGSHCTTGKQCCSTICTNRQCAAEVGPGPQCTVAADCAGVDDECQTRTCTGGICDVAYTRYGTPAGNQILGDCKTNVCNGAGGIDPMIDDTDTPPDIDECTVGSCTNGEPGSAPREMFSPCSTNGGNICDGAGHCAVCVPGQTQSCYTGPGGTAGIGVCQAGTQTCRSDGSGFDACAGEVLPSPETCNGLDDNCDGMVDDYACTFPKECHSIRDTYRCCIPFGLNAGGDCSQCCAGRCRSFPFSSECAELE